MVHRSSASPWKRGGNADFQLLRGSIHSLFLGTLRNAFGGQAVSAIGNPQAGKMMREQKAGAWALEKNRKTEKEW